MNVSALGVNDLPEEPLSCHVQRKQFKEIVTTVLEDHAMLPCFFRSLHQLPALFYGNGSRNFYRYVFTLLHGVYGHGSMKTPGRGDVDQVDVFSFAGFFPLVLIAGVDLRLMGSILQ